MSWRPLYSWETSSSPEMLRAIAAAHEREARAAMNPNKRFTNYNTGTQVEECTEQRGDRWYILMGFAGFNTRANNGDGYPTKKAAEAACLERQKR